MRFVMDYQLASAIGKDAGNRAMRKGKRSAWSREDYNESVTAFHRALPCPADLECETCTENNAKGGR